MSKVSITKEKLDYLAEVVGAKSGQGITLSLDEMAEAVKDIPVGLVVKNQNKIVTPSESRKVVKPDTGYTGLGSVTVGAIAPNYIGSNIERRDSSDLTSSGEIVFVPAGYYSEDTGASVVTRSLNAPTISLDSSTGAISAQIYQESGYVGTSSRTANYQLPTQSGKVIKPDGTIQTAVASNKFTLDNVYVSPMELSETTVTPNNSTQEISPYSLLDVLADSGTKYLSSTNVIYIEFKKDGNSVQLPSPGRYLLEVDATFGWPVYETGTNKLKINKEILISQSGSFSVITPDEKPSFVSEVRFSYGNFTELSIYYTVNGTEVFNNLVINSVSIKKIKDVLIYSSFNSNADEASLSPINALDFSNLVENKIYNCTLGVYLYSSGRYSRCNSTSFSFRYTGSGNLTKFLLLSNSGYTTYYYYRITVDFENNRLIYDYNTDTSSQAVMSGEFPCGTSGQQRYGGGYIQITLEINEPLLKDGFSKVTVNPIPALENSLVYTQTYGSGIEAIDVANYKYLYLDAGSHTVTLLPQQITITDQPVAINFEGYPTEIINPENTYFINGERYDDSFGYSYEGGNYHLSFQLDSLENFVDIWSEEDNSEGVVIYFAVFDFNDQIVPGIYDIAIFSPGK